MKSLLKNTVKGLIGIVATAVITAWITGQPLTGLTKLGGIYQTFIRSSVPAWAFALVLLVALIGMYYALVNWPRRRPKGTVHFVPDAHNNGWSRQTDKTMNVRISGSFTYDGRGDLSIFRAFLNGTQPVTDMMAQVERPDGNGMMTVSEIRLEAAIPQRVMIDLVLTPVRGTLGKPLHRKLLLHDKFNRDFPIDITLPYFGR